MGVFRKNPNTSGGEAGGEGAAEMFVADNHVDEEDVEEGELVDEVEPGLADDEGDEESDGAPVEGEDVGVFHQRERELTEFVAEPCWYLSVGVGCAQSSAQLLHGG